MQEKSFDRELFLHNFSIRLKKLIKILGINQRKLSNRLGIAHGFVSEVVNGKKLPGIGFLYSLHIEYKINSDYLITGEGEIFSNLATGVDGEAKNEEIQNKALKGEIQKLYIEIQKLSNKNQLLQEMLKDAISK